MMHRRELLLVGAGIVAAKATASTIACANDGPAPEGKTAPKKDAKGADAKADGKAGGHEGHEGHEGHGSDEAHKAAATPAENNELANETAACVAAGEACLAHCLRLLSEGDKSMGECSKTVHAMLAICKGTGPLAVAQNKHLAAAAQLCHDVCSDCAEACKPHVDHHAECKACFEACTKTMAAAKKFV